jgi:hypothetical protein
MRSSTATIASPYINVWLTKLGLAQTQVIGRSLTIYVDHTPFPVTFPLAPPFFTSLAQVGALVIQECQNCFGGNPNVPPTGPSALLALPGFFALIKFWNFNAASGQPSSLIVTGTALPNFFGTVSGLQCSPGLVKITNNRALISLGGLEALNTTLRPGPTVQITDNALVGPASVAALVGLAGCPASPLTSVILVQTTTCSATVRSVICVTTSSLCVRGTVPFDCVGMRFRRTMTGLGKAKQRTYTARSFL